MCFDGPGLELVGERMLVRSQEQAAAIFVSFVPKYWQELVYNRHLTPRDI